MKYTPAQVKKALVAAATFVVNVVAVLLAGNLIPVDWLPWVVAGVGLAGTYGVFAAQNAGYTPRHSYDAGSVNASESGQDPDSRLH